MTARGEKSPADLSKNGRGFLILSFSYPEPLFFTGFEMTMIICEANGYAYPFISPHQAAVISSPASAAKGIEHDCAGGEIPRRLIEERQGISHPVILLSGASVLHRIRNDGDYLCG